ncbi:DNA oxidative demethylase AlkB [Uliginosibacterium sp. sgz301328]|uniref:DNA oxidative demethylase AlkB n=1 Tax=Uliginosibacterium sp. sgz301328 TaxID=3243764 RepID=UPI00359D7A4D
MQAKAGGVLVVQGETGQTDLFGLERSGAGNARQLAEGAWLLEGFARARSDVLLADLRRIETAAPFRHMVTPGGAIMSVAMTHCGQLGWVSDRHGYRYATNDPETGKSWPSMPEAFLALAKEAAAAAGFAAFVPDSCLINRYAPGTRLSLHQDKDEQDLAQPIVSVSLGLPAVFLFGGFSRAERAQRVPLFHGDVVVWGGPSRLRFHGVLPVAEGLHPSLGACRVNLTFRKAGLVAT